MALNKQHPLYQEDLQRVLTLSGLERLKGKTILITGATGLLGSHLIDALMLFGGVMVVAVGRSRDKASERLGAYYNHPLFSFLEQDVCLPFPTDLQVDYVIPLASNTHPLAYSRFPVETVMVNVKGAEHALELATRCGATVLYPSSVEVYGNATGTEIFTEDYTGKLNLSTSRSCYTESKRVSEALCQSYRSEHGVSVKIARLSRVFGPTMLTNDSKASSQFILKAVHDEDIVLKSEGKQYFSYTYVTDAVMALLHILLHGEDGVVYNVANPKCNVHLRDFAQLCADCCGRQVVFDLPTETESQGYSIAVQAIQDTTRLEQTGFTPYYIMQDAVRRTVELLRSSLV